MRETIGRRVKQSLTAISVIGLGFLLGILTIRKTMIFHNARNSMQVSWRSMNDEQGGDYNLTWEYGSYTVNATQYDTDEWVVRYGEDGNNPSELYSRGIFTREDALIEAKACMRDLTMEHVSQSEESLVDKE